MFALTTPTRWDIHDLGQLSNVTVNGRPETIFFATTGEQVECWEHATHDRADALAAVLNAQTREQVQQWIAENRNW